MALFLFPAKFILDIKPADPSGLLALVIFSVTEKKKGELLMLTCKDNYTTTFSSFGEMLRYHECLSKESVWRRCKVKELHVQKYPYNDFLYQTYEE